LLLQTPVSGTYRDPACERSIATFGQMAALDLRTSLARTGVSVSTDGSAPHDAVAKVALDVHSCNAVSAFGQMTVTIEPNIAVVQDFVWIPGDNGCGGAAAPEGGTCLDPLAMKVTASPGLRGLAARARSNVREPQPAQVHVVASANAAPATGPAAAGSTSAPLFAEGIPAVISGSPQRNAYAFVVGIDKYRDAPAAPSARADAEKFAALARLTLGLPDDQVRVALDDRAGIVDIRKGLKWLKTSVPAGGRAYFFFAGHGAPDASAGTPYLLPYDGDAKDLKESAVELQEVLAALGETSGAQAIAIVDACFSGAGGRSVLPEGARPLVRVKSTNAGAKVALFSASTGAEISGPDPSGKGGLFTSVLVEGLGKAGADIDGNGDVTLGELGTWVVPRVKREASALGREQTPGLTLGAGLKAEEVVLGAGLGKR
jgi:hypothetical protein